MINNLVYSLPSKTKDIIDDNLIAKKFKFCFFQNQDLYLNKEIFTEIFTRKNIFSSIRKALDAEDEYTTSSSDTGNEDNVSADESAYASSNHSDDERSISGSDSDSFSE